MVAWQALHLPESDEDHRTSPGALDALSGWAVSP
jgi:hypothetical protein